MPRKKGRSWSLKVGKYKIRLGYSKRKRSRKTGRRRRRKRRR